MGKQICLKLLILCTALCQGFATLSNNGSADSSDLLARKRRVVDRTPNANTRIRFRDVNYVVHVLENNAPACAGTILSPVVVIVPCSCVMNFAIYTVISGTLSTRNGRVSVVNGILRHPHYQHHTYVFNIALLRINTPLTVGRQANQPITIANGPLVPNTMVRVSGYGLAVEHRGGGLTCGHPIRGPPRMAMPNELRSIMLPTISIHDCRIYHNEPDTITSENVICTHHEDKYCAPGDIGSPLVFEGQLYGILSWDRRHGDPEIFINLASPRHRNWIYEHMNNIPHYDGPPAHQQGQGRHRRPSLSQVHPVNDDDKK